MNHKSCGVCQIRWWAERLGNNDEMELFCVEVERQVLQGECPAGVGMKKRAEEEGGGDVAAAHSTQ